MTKRIFSKVFLVITTFVLAVLLFGSTAWGEGCFTIVVGKDVSADGYVIMAHNEDDSAPQVVNHYKVPRIRWSAGEKVKLTNGGELEQAEQTWAYIWSEMPGLLFSDSYINEWGVCIASDNCPSREDDPELTDGGINRMLRRLVAQRAKSAREGVLLAGELVERFGYDAAGRTYTICDPDEGWLFCAINGKHWLAKRVPDDEVAMIANTLTVHQVDLTDQDNFLAADDIVEYAVSREWYNPDKDGPFDFAAVYADPKVAADSSNFCRQWSGLRHVASEPIPLGENLPFSVVPRSKLDVAAVMQILRDHYEGTELYQMAPETGCPHTGSFHTVCNRTTQTSFVAQLRRDKPLDIGIVYWVCLAPPCASFYLPFHFGIQKFPAGYSTGEERPSEESYRQRITSPFAADPLTAFWTFSNFSHKIDAAYNRAISRVKAETEEVEKRAIALQVPIEETALRLYPVNQTAAQELLTNHARGLYMSALGAMETVLSEK